MREVTAAFALDLPQSDQAVGHKAADAGIIDSGQQPGTGALADAEQTDAARVGVRPLLEVTQRRPGVLYFIIGHPLERFVVRLAVAVALVARLERKDVI